MQLFNIFIFPGFLFLFVFAMYAEFVDRRLYARFQSRIGPPIFQPLADFIKLLAKEDMVPEEANARFFKLMPLIALTSVVTAILYVPIWNTQAVSAFPGDIVVVLYLLTIPTLCFFVGGWYSTSLYARIGSSRLLVQLFAYEVPLYMSILSTAIISDSWSISGILQFHAQHPWYWVFNLIGFVVAIIALIGKLEKAPFDIPDAETEIVAGAFTEYSGKLLAFLKLTLSIEMIVGASLIAAIFLPFGYNLPPLLAFVLYIIKVLSIVAIVALVRTVFARMRLDQMIEFCWKFVVPLALLQVIINLFLEGFLIK